MVALRADRLGELSPHPGLARLIERGLSCCAHGRGRPAGGDRGTRPSGGAAPRTRSGRPAGARRRGRTGRAAAALARPAPDLAAPRGPHPDRRGLPGLRRHPRRRRPDRRTALRERPRRPAAARCATSCCAWWRPPPTGARPLPGPSPARRHRPRARAAHRTARLRPAGDQRRRRGGARPRGARPRLAPAARLAGRRRRRATDLRHLSAAAEAWDAHGPPGHRALPRRSAGPSRSSGATGHTRPQRPRAALPRRQPDRRRRPSSGTPRTGPHRPANRRLRAQLAATGIALVAALVVGVVAVRQRDRAPSAGPSPPPGSSRPPPTPTSTSTPNAASCWRSPRSTGPDPATAPVLPEAEQALHDAVTASRLELRVPDVGGASTGAPTAPASRPRARMAPASSSSTTPPPATPCDPSPPTTATSTASPSATTAPCSAPRARTATPRSGTRRPGRSCTRSRARRRRRRGPVQPRRLAVRRGVARRGRLKSWTSARGQIVTEIARSRRRRRVVRPERRTDRRRAEAGRRRSSWTSIR